MRKDAPLCVYEKKRNHAGAANNIKSKKLKAPFHYSRKEKEQAISSSGGKTALR